MFLKKMALITIQKGESDELFFLKTGKDKS